MQKAPLGLATGIALVMLCVLSVWPSHAQESKGRHRIVQMDGKVVEGDLIETETAYLIEVKMGEKGKLTVTVPKNQVKELIRIDEAAAADGAETAESGLVSSEEVARILGPEEDYAILDELLDGSSNAMSPSPVNEESITQMSRIAGEKSEYLTTDHFLLVYTSTPQAARELAARLERVYEWNVNFMKKMGVPSHAPDYKLEIYFFGTHKEFERYAAYDLGMSQTGGILGFYMPPTNRSAFFEMSTFPPYANALKYAEQKEVPLQRRREIKNKVARMVEYQNLEVIQHEAGHHMHFNMGLFNPRADRAGKWLSEGMAVQFEVPPTRHGGSLGAINHERLRQLRMIWQPYLEADPPPMDFFRAFLWQGNIDYTGAHYSLGWAVIYYLRSKYEEGFARYLQAVAQWEDDTEISLTEKQKLWEDNFGELTEQWIKDMGKFILSIPLRTDELPPDDLR